MVLSAGSIGGVEARGEMFSYPFMVYVICLSLLNQRINKYHITALLLVSIIAVRFHIEIGEGLEIKYGLSEGIEYYVRRFIFALNLCIATLLVYYSIFNNKVYSAIMKLVPKRKNE